MTQKNRFAIFGNVYQRKKSQAIFKLIAILQRYDAEIYVDRPFYEFISEGQHMDVKVDGIFDGDDFDVDYAISMGGDGTLLKTAARVHSKDTPIIGINIGRLGFLADVAPSDIIETSGEEKLESGPFALNDIAILKRDNASMISIRTSINGEYVTTYQADGLIVTTPTGSTAYNLSNGGPIIAPGTGTLCLTAVAPHSLNIRPIVVPDSSVISLKVESRSHSVLVAVDGKSTSLHDGTEVRISKAKHTVRIIRFSDRKYYSTLREKMMWGLDQR